MKSNIFSFIVLTFGLSASALLLSSPSAHAEELKTPSTVRELLAQTGSVKITSVTLNASGTGVEIMTDGKVFNPTTRTQGKVSYTDIPNAVLSLPDGKEFRVKNPVKGIANISVTQVSSTFGRMLITGTNGLPTSQVVVNEKGLVIISTPAVITSEDDEEDIVVTGEQQNRGL